jgi:hypothetical protein
MKTIAEPVVLEATIARLGRLTPDTSRRWGTMTPAELLCHLGDNMEMALGTREVPAGMKHGWASRLAKMLILGTEIPFPKGVPTRPRLDPRREGTKPAQFESDRARVVRGLRALATRNGADPGPTHGRFGPMTMADWQRQGYRHTDHHLKQFGL